MIVVIQTRLRLGQIKGSRSGTANTGGIPNSMDLRSPRPYMHEFASLTELPQSSVVRQCVLYEEHKTKGKFQQAKIIFLSIILDRFEKLFTRSQVLVVFFGNLVIKSQVSINQFKVEKPLIVRLCLKRIQSLGVRSQ